MDGSEMDGSIVEDDRAYRGQLPKNKESIINRRREMGAEEDMVNTTNMEPRPSEVDEEPGVQPSEEADIGAVVVELAHLEDVDS